MVATPFVKRKQLVSLAVAPIWFSAEAFAVEEAGAASLKRRRRKARSDSLAASTDITPDFYVPDDWVTSDLALPAAKEALKRAAANPKTLTCIPGTTLPD